MGKEGITIDKVITEGGMDIKNAMKNDELPRLSAFTVLALKEVWVNTDNIFTNESVSGCALLLLSEYPDWLPKEILVMLKNGIAGKYGKTYGKVSTATIMEWAQCYEVERLHYFEKKKSEKPKADWKDIDPKIFPKMGEPKREPAKATAPTEWAQGILKEFDKEAKEIGNKRWIRYKGFTLDVNEYLQYRFNEEKTI